MTIDETGNMAGRIYQLNSDSSLVALDEAPYDTEKLLQQTLAKYPDLLAGEQINSDDPRRWLLVTREMSVPGEEEVSSKWSLDHLFLDQDGVPTLVEVKKGANTDIRRKVVGQMLDYAANAVVYWPVEEIRAKFELRCNEEDIDPEKLLTDFLSEDQEVDDYWQIVKTNLQAGRIRMIFVADDIPSRLRRIVEFLNQQMDPAEVLAIEVKQFVGNDIKTLVPRVFGQTKKTTSVSPAIDWDEAKFLAKTESLHGNEVRTMFEEFLHWIKPPRVTKLKWGRGSKHGGVTPTIVIGNSDYRVCRLNTWGWVVFRFDWLSRIPPFKTDESRRELLARINEIPGCNFGEDKLKKPVRVTIQMLSQPGAIDALQRVVEWEIAKLNAES